jgi:hypothetical protein
MPVTDFLREASGISDSQRALAGCVISQNDALIYYWPAICAAVIQCDNFRSNLKTVCCSICTREKR